MPIWIWIFSLVVLAACFIFIYWMMVSSYDDMSNDKKLLPGFKRRKLPGPAVNEETITALRYKIKALEEQNDHQEIEFSKFRKRLDSLENSTITMVSSSSKKPVRYEENWKELYYGENELKEKLENELDELRHQFEVAELKNSPNKSDEKKLASLQSDYDARLNDLKSLQEELDHQQLKLEAAMEFNKKLDQQLQTAIHDKKQFHHLQTSHAHLKCENENMRAHLKEMNKREEELENRLAHARELESKVALFEEEKYKMISEMEEKISQNKMFFSSE